MYPKPEYTYAARPPPAASSTLACHNDVPAHRISVELSVPSAPGGRLRCTLQHLIDVLGPDGFRALHAAFAARAAADPTPAMPAAVAGLSDRRGCAAVPPPGPYDLQASLRSRTSCTGTHRWTEAGFGFAGEGTSHPSPATFSTCPPSAPESPPPPPDRDDVSYDARGDSDARAEDDDDAAALWHALISSPGQPADDFDSAAGPARPG